jgi:predicted Zn finger-like uncharacterized protein
MYTVCPKCALTLVVTAADLRVAQGYVRCGRCSNVFNALARLSEDRNAAAAAAAGSQAGAPRQSQSTTPPATPAQQSVQQPPASPARPAQPTSSYTFARPPEPSNARQAQPSASPAPRPSQQPQPARTPPQPSSTPPPLPTSLAGEIEDDETIPEDALEFNPAAADVNQVFVEPPPNPEWTAATGTFKALVLQGEATASNPTAPAAKPRSAEPPARVSQIGLNEDEIELDADFLSATAEMRKLQLDLSDTDSGSRPAPGPGLSQPATSKAAPASPAPPEAHSRMPHAAEPPARSQSQPSRDSQARQQSHPAADTPRSQAHARNDAEEQPYSFLEPVPRSQPHTHAEAPARARTAQSEPPSPARARASSETHSQAAPRISQQNAEPGSSSEPDIVARVPPRKTVRAFGLDSADPPTDQLASLARSRIAPSAFELETPSPASRISRLLTSSPTLWAAGAGALLVLLLVQILNHYRNDLAATSQFNRPITAIYSALGVHLTPRWDLHAYDVRQLGASVDAESAGQIMVRASVKNSGHQAQPMPLLRVTLQDRFGNRIAARDVAPGNYLPAAIPASAFLSAGQRIDAEMAFVDPGANAVGFEIDACLPAPAGGIACANDPISR